MAIKYNVWVSVESFDDQYGGDYKTVDEGKVGFELDRDEAQALANSILERYDSPYQIIIPQPEDSDG